MKSRICVMICAVLALGLLKSIPGVAQAEIAPDHFDVPSADEAARVQTLAPARTAGAGLGTFQGSFTLLHQVNCAGLTIPAGDYSLSSIRSTGGWSLVTMTSKNAAIGVQARIKLQSGDVRRAALIVERSGAQRVVTGISLAQPGRMLRLQGEHSQSVSAKTEQVPVFSTTRAKAAN